MTTEPESKAAEQGGDPEGKLHGWFTGRLPADWFTGPADVTLDREEITVVGPLAEPEPREGASDAERSEAVGGPVRRFRQDTRDHRLQIPREAQHNVGRKRYCGA